MLNLQGYFSRVLVGPGVVSLLARACLVLCCATFLLVPARAIADAMVLDHQVKAAMLYKFLGYTEWPATSFVSAQSPFRIWVLGTPVIADELREITARREINGRAIEIFHATSDRQLERPHLVFVGRPAEKYLPRLMSMAEQHSFLIVTENDTGLLNGSAINLRLIDGRIGFDVSLIGAQKSNLKLSSRLLSVAASIEQEER